MNKINLIWQTSKGEESYFEFEYITELLFSKFDYTIHLDFKRYSLVMENAVIIYCNNHRGPSFEFLNYLNKFKRNHFQFSLLHLSNEGLFHNCDYYELAQKVFRSYYDPKIQQENVTFLPLGFKSGYLNKDNNYNLKEKKFDFAFIGQPKSDRLELIEVLKTNGTNFIHATQSWNCKTALSQSECRDIYANSKFVPCPKGWINPDSFRIMETLESGSIPILRNYDNMDYFEKPWETNAPIPIVSDWSEIINFANLNESEYSDLYETIFGWYRKFKKSLPDRVYQKMAN